MLKKIFITGLAAVIPLAITIYVISGLFYFADEVIGKDRGLDLAIGCLQANVAVPFDTSDVLDVHVYAGCLAHVSPR